MAATAENFRDMAQAEAACLREELKGVGHSPSPFLLPVASRLWSAFMHYFNVSNHCWCRVVGGSMLSRRATSTTLGGGG